MTTTLAAPHSVEFEERLLGTMIAYSDSIPDISAIVGPEMFYGSDRRKLCKAIFRMHGTSKPVDTITIYEELMKDGEVQDGVATELSILSGDALPLGRGAEWYAHRVRQLWAQRQILLRADTLRSIAADASEEYEAVYDYAERLAEGLELAAGEFTTMEQAAEGALRNIEWSVGHPGQTRGLPVESLPTLTDMLNGFQGGEYYILAARPSEGKTALGLEIARQAGKHAPVLFVSKEMSATALTERMLSRQSGVNGQVMRTGQMSQDAYRRVVDAGPYLKSLPVVFDEQSVTADDVRAAVRKAVRTLGVKLVVVDYLQLLDPPRGIRAESRDERVTMTSRMMKRVAVEQNVAMLVLAQLNRALDSRGDKRPQLSDLRESGSIEQDCDTAMFLYHPHKHGDKDDAGYPIQDNRMEILVRKQRNGPTGMVIAYFNPDTGKIGEWSNR